MPNKIVLSTLLVLSWLGVSFAQTTITGIVTDAATATPLIGVSIFAESGAGAISDVDGRYTITVSNEDKSLTFTYVGYSDQRINIGALSVIDVQMVEGVTIGDEVVVVGYGTQKKSVVTGSISQVKADDLEDMQINRVEQALQGRTSGIRITQGSGAPGSGSTVRIRGTSSIGGSDPLFVVDGVIIGGGIDYLNPNDIQSIEVLKDAASAAIYGARGANGVIIVTTKGGQKGKMRINYSGFYGVQNPWKKLPLLNAREYAIIQREMHAAGNTNPPAPIPDPNTLGEGTDWQDEIFYRNAPIQSNELSISGGTDRMTYYSSVNLFQQDGIIGEGKSNYQRLSARLNTESQVTERFKFGMNIAYTHIESQGFDPNTEFGSPLGRALNIDPITPLYETDEAVINDPNNQYTLGNATNLLVEDANGVYGISPYVTSEIVNPAAALYLLNGKGWSDKFVPNVFGEIEIIKGLKARSSFGGDLAFYGGDGFTPAHFLNATNIVDTNQISVNMNNSFTWIWDNTLQYDFTIQEDHIINVLVGHSAQTTKGNYLGGSKRDVPSQNYDEATIDYARNEASEQVFGGFWENYAIESYFSRLSYNYKGKYIVQAIFRADASTRFGSNNRWGYFPSVSVAWNVNEEDFWKQNDIINAVKIRGGWGRNGNDNAGTLEFAATIAGNQSYTLGTGDVLVNGTAPAQVSNADLRWETVEQINIGADIRFLKNFSLVLDYYIQNTLDMKTVAPIPAYIGNNPATSNVGDMRNSGFDIELGYQTEIRGVNINFGGNVSYVENEVVRIGNEAGFVQGQTWGPQGIEITRITDGLPIGYLYGYVADGVFQTEADVAAHTGEGGAPLQPLAQAGDLRFVDVNGDGVLDEDDRTLIGDPTPTWTYGFTLDAAYKGFDLVIFGQGVGGNEIFNASRRYDLPSANMRADALGRWTGAGTSTDYPRLTTQDANVNFGRSSSFYVENGAFFRIKSAQLGYTLPREITQYASIGKARFYVAANNLVTITQYQGFDPEIGSGVDRGIYPQARSYTFGVNITFE